MEHPDDAALTAWAANQPLATTEDPIWSLVCYRHAAYLVTLARNDAATIGRNAILSGIAAQLLTASASVAANIAEGYGRPTMPDRIRFFSYALGSVREALTWYEAAASALSESARTDRAMRLVRIRRMLLGLLRTMRARAGRPLDPW